MGRRFLVNRLVLPASALALLGCFGEDAATFRGTVVEAQDGGTTDYAFEAWPNPNGLVPIEGATVELCMDDCGHPQTDETDALGRWGDLSTGVFPIGVDDGPRLRITVEAEGYAPFEYAVDHLDAPHYATSGVRFMNIRLVRDPDNTPDAGP